MLAEKIISRHLSRNSRFLTSSKRPSSSGSRKRYSRLFTSSSDAPSQRFTKKQPPAWLWTMGAATAAGAGIWTWISSDTPSNSYNDKEDKAKATYLSCIGEELSGPLPIEDCPISFVPDVPPPITRDYPACLRLDMNTSLRQVPLDSTHLYEIWSFNGGAPGPFIRARQGDTLDVSFTNNDETGMWHNVDFHAVSGPGGGAEVLTSEKGETRSAQFKLLYPGLFIYHCAVYPVAEHIANGMYGLILVEPEGGLPPVDREYVVVQSEFYTNDEPDEPGSRLLGINEQRLEEEKPNYVVLNGRVGSMTDDDGEPLKANAGERVRIYFGNAGPNLVSSFHIIGGIMDKVYREGDLISPPARGLQTTLVPAGGAAVVELVPTCPGTLTLIDHSISRVDKGAVGFLRVSGPKCPAVFHSDKEPRPCLPCKIHP